MWVLVLVVVLSLSLFFSSSPHWNWLGRIIIFMYTHYTRSIRYTNCTATTRKKLSWEQQHFSNNNRELHMIFLYRQTVSSVRLACSHISFFLHLSPTYVSKYSFRSCLPLPCRLLLLESDNDGDGDRDIFMRIYEIYDESMYSFYLVDGYLAHMIWWDTNEMKTGVIQSSWTFRLQVIVIESSGISLSRCRRSGSSWLCSRSNPVMFMRTWDRLISSLLPNSCIILSLLTKKNIACKLYMMGNGNPLLFP